MIPFNERNCIERSARRISIQYSAPGGNHGKRRQKTFGRFKFSGGTDYGASSWGNGELSRFLSKKYVSFTLGSHRAKQKNGRLRSAKCRYRFRVCTKANPSQGFTGSGAYSNRVLANANEIVDRASERPQRDGDESSGSSVEGCLSSLVLIDSVLHLHKHGRPERYRLVIVF